MIAVKREVAAEKQVFRGANVKLGNWRQVTVQFKILFVSNGWSVWVFDDTHGNVYSHRLSYFY